MKKPPDTVTQTGPYAALPDDLVDTAPVLAEFLTATCYEGDVPGTRQTSTLLVFAQDGAWKACLRDRERQKCLWVAAARYNDLIAVLEDSLANGTGVWRDDRASGAQEAKRNPRQKPT